MEERTSPFSSIVSSQKQEETHPSVCAFAQRSGLLRYGGNDMQGLLDSYMEETTIADAPAVLNTLVIKPLKMNTNEQER
jgi:hypothetical protein